MPETHLTIEAGPLITICSREQAIRGCPPPSRPLLSRQPPLAPPRGPKAPTCPARTPRLCPRPHCLSNSPSRRRCPFQCRRGPSNPQPLETCRATTNPCPRRPLQLCPSRTTNWFHLRRRKTAEGLKRRRAGFQAGDHPPRSSSDNNSSQSLPHPASTIPRLERLCSTPWPQGHKLCSTRSTCSSQRCIDPPILPTTPRSKEGRAQGAPSPSPLRRNTASHRSTHSLPPLPTWRSVPPRGHHLLPPQLPCLSRQRISTPLREAPRPRRARGLRRSGPNATEVRLSKQPALSHLTQTYLRLLKACIQCREVRI